MKTTQTRKPAVNKEAITDRANDLSLQLEHVTQTLKLAAFATETRRVLDGIEDAFFTSPEITQRLSARIPCFSEWLEMEDATSSVLGQAVREIQRINEELANVVYALVDAATD